MKLISLLMALGAMLSGAWQAGLLIFGGGAMICAAEILKERGN